MKKQLFLAIFCSFFAVACTHSQRHDAYTNIEDLEASYEALKADDQAPPAAPRFVDAQLSDTARTVNQSLKRLATIETATHPQAKMPPPINPYTIEMAQKASVDWTGPAQPLLEKIASASHYQLHTLGNAPAIPVLIRVTAKEQTLAQIIRNIGYQIRVAANITIYPERKIIELRYVQS